MIEKHKNFENTLEDPEVKLLENELLELSRRFNQKSEQYDAEILETRNQIEKLKKEIEDLEKEEKSQKELEKKNLEELKEKKTEAESLEDASIISVGQNINEIELEPKPKIEPEAALSEIERTKKRSFKKFVNHIGTIIGSKLSYLTDNFFGISKREVNDNKILVLDEPKKITIEEVINENISSSDKQEIQKEFPDQDIEKIIEDKVVEGINNKKIFSPEEKKKESKLMMTARKIRNYLLIVFVSTSLFEGTTSFKSYNRDVASYDNIRVDNLKDWENVNLYEDEVNKLENISIITKANENSNDKYIIVDKQNGKAHRYQGDNLIKSYNICLGDSIGDEQTFLKSIYKKKLRARGVDEDGDIIYDTKNVSIEEATYVKNGERYLKEGYDAWTDWGAGNMKTGAGIYTISNKGPFLKDYGIFLKNERDEQVATSLHVNSHLEERAPDFRFTNGCVGFSKKDLMEIYESASVGEKIYILPENSQNRFQIIDGELRFLSNQKNVNRTIRPYEKKPIILQAENPTEDAKVWLVTLSKNKEKLMSLYPIISNDVYNELAKISYGIMGQESSFGTYGGPRGQYGRVKDIGLSAIGFEPSVGLGQVRIENVEKKVRDAFNLRKNIDLFNTENNAIATMSILLENYQYIFLKGRGDDYKELTILKFNASKEAVKIIKNNKKIEQLGPKSKNYIKKVLSYSERAHVYTKNVNRKSNNFTRGYNQSGQLAMK